MRKLMKIPIPKLNNTGGFVFVTVLTIVIVMMIVAVSILSMNISQTMVTEKEIDRIQAEVLAAGAVSYALTEKNNDPNSDSKTITQQIDQNTFSVTTSITNDSSGPFDTQPMKVEVNY
jgi:Tfp pilus assembly protein PilX